MSLTSKQIDELRAYANDRKGELAKLISDAADTIELLSAKLSASNMERSSQYYHGGWIPCSERLPEENTDILVTYVDGEETRIIPVNYGLGTWYDCIFDAALDPLKITAWMPLPEPYREE